MSANPKIVWTEAEDALLRELRAAGVSSAQIAAQIPGKSRNAVVGRANRLGLESKFGPRRCGPAKAKPALRPVRLLPSRTPRQFAKPVRVEPAEAPAAPLALDLLDLRPGQCHWPHGDGPFTFCGQPIERVGSDHPYCQFHNWVSYRPPRTEVAA